jgi:hypothetical protein
MTRKIKDEGREPRLWSWEQVKWISMGAHRQQTIHLSSLMELLERKGIISKEELFKICDEMYDEENEEGFRQVYCKKVWGIERKIKDEGTAPIDIIAGKKVSCSVCRKLISKKTPWLAIGGDKITLEYAHRACLKSTKKS